jgi:glycosyltransferase involved in cell wall biosynthesis
VRPRILFVVNDVLGWSTYGALLESALATRTDFEHAVLRRRLPHAASALLRRHADRHLARYARPLDPITAHAGMMGLDIRRAIARHTPDLVHVAAHWPASAALGVTPRIPVTAALDATRPAITRDLPLPGWSAREINTERRLVGQLSHVFAMSRWSETSLFQDLGLPESRVSVMPPSLDTHLWPPSVDRSDRGRVPSILFVGNDLTRKGAHRLARWMEGPLAGRAHLHIVSGDTRTKISGPDITFHGRVPHVRLVQDLLPAMDLFCLPTRLDMSPHVLIEAAAAGLPAISSRLAGIPDLIQHDKTGLLVDPDDDAGFLSALNCLIDDPDLRLRMGSAARTMARERFDGTRNFNGVFETLLGLVKSGGTSP